MTNTFTLTNSPLVTLKCEVTQKRSGANVVYTTKITLGNDVGNGSRYGYDIKASLEYHIGEDKATSIYSNKILKPASTSTWKAGSRSISETKTISKLVDSTEKVTFKFSATGNGKTSSADITLTVPAAASAIKITRNPSINSTNTPGTISITEYSSDFETKTYYKVGDNSYVNFSGTSFPPTNDTKLYIQALALVTSAKTSIPYTIRCDTYQKTTKIGSTTATGNIAISSAICKPSSKNVSIKNTKDNATGAGSLNILKGETYFNFSGTFEPNGSTNSYITAVYITYNGNNTQVISNSNKTVGKEFVISKKKISNSFVSNTPIEYYCKDNKGFTSPKEKISLGDIKSRSDFVNNFQITATINPVYYVQDGLGATPVFYRTLYNITNNETNIKDAKISITGGQLVPAWTQTALYSINDKDVKDTNAQSYVKEKQNFNTLLSVNGTDLANKTKWGWDINQGISNSALKLNYGLGELIADNQKISGSIQATIEEDCWYSVVIYSGSENKKIWYSQFINQDDSTLILKDGEKIVCTYSANGLVFSEDIKGEYSGHYVSIINNVSNNGEIKDCDLSYDKDNLYIMKDIPRHQTDGLYYFYDDKDAKLKEKKFSEKYSEEYSKYPNYSEVYGYSGSNKITVTQTWEHAYVTITASKTSSQTSTPLFDWGEPRSDYGSEKNGKIIINPQTDDGDTAKIDNKETFNFNFNIPIDLPYGHFLKDGKYGINMHNSDIVEVNMIAFGDTCRSRIEGILFPVSYRSQKGVLKENFIMLKVLRENGTNEGRPFLRALEYNPKTNEYGNGFNIDFT